MPKAPLLPTTMSETKPASVPGLIHPALNNVPQQVRFGLAGGLGNIIFLILYNVAVNNFEGTYPASTVYMVVYLLFIPITHALVSLLVFGWPTKYVTSLMSNVPIGLSGMALGTALTSYLDKISFNEKVEDFIREHIPEWEDSATDEDEKGELYSSILVLIVTSVWGYTLSVAVNSKKPEEAKEKKEL